MNLASENLADFYNSVTQRLRAVDEAKFRSFCKPVGDCLVWTGAMLIPENGGYGTITIWGKKFRAHRFSYLLNVGPIPKGLFVCHKCDNPICVKPDHLFLGTHMQNMIDRQMKGRTATGARCRPKNPRGGKSFGNSNGARKFPERLKRGMDNHNAKLTPEKVNEIRSEYSERHTSYRRLAKQFGVSWTAIMYIITRKNWKHI